MAASKKYIKRTNFNSSAYRKAFYKWIQKKEPEAGDECQKTQTDTKAEHVRKDDAERKGGARTRGPKDEYAWDWATGGITAEQLQGVRDEWIKGMSEKSGVVALFRAARLQRDPLDTKLSVHHSDKEPVAVAEAIALKLAESFTATEEERCFN